MLGGKKKGKKTFRVLRRIWITLTEDMAMFNPFVIKSCLMCFTISNYNDKVYQKPSVQANIDNTSLVFNKLQLFKHKFTQFC